MRLPSLQEADPGRLQRPTLSSAAALSNIRRCSSRWRRRSSSEPAASAATGNRSRLSAFAEISSLVLSATMPVSPQSLRREPLERRVGVTLIQRGVEIGQEGLDHNGVEASRSSGIEVFSQRRLGRSIFGLLLDFSGLAAFGTPDRGAARRSSSDDA